MGAIWNSGTVSEAIRETFGQKSDYIRMAKEWQRMWDLEYWDDQRSAHLPDYYRRVTSSMPKNEASLGIRLMEDHPSISCPVVNDTEKEQVDKESRERFLTALWDRQQKSSKFSPIRSLKWQMMVRGRCAVQTAWVKNSIPTPMQQFHPPIRIRPLDPMDVGIEWGPLFPLWAYNQYRTTWRNVQQRYPKAKVSESYDAAEKVAVTDFWYVHTTGRIYNGVMVGGGTHGLDAGEFLTKPRVTDYPLIPILERINDGVPVKGEGLNGAAIFEPNREMWGHMNEALSMEMTGVERHFFPTLLQKNQYGFDVPDIDQGPGEINPVPEGTEVDELPGKPDIALINSFAAKIDAMAEQGTWSRVLYGDAGQMTAGYGIPLLASAATSRIHDTVTQLVAMMEQVNEIALCIVKKFAGPAGVELYAYDKNEDQVYAAALYPDQISSFANTVKLGTNIPGDEMQLALIALQYKSAGVLSARTTRDAYPGDVPEDEAFEILAEGLREHPLIKDAMIKRTAWIRHGIDLELEERAAEEQAQAEQEQAQMQAQMQAQQEQEQILAQQGQAELPVPQIPGPGDPSQQPASAQQNTQTQQVLPGQLGPEQQGQMTPETVGLPADLPPELWALITGGQVTPEEMLAELQGIPRNERT